MLGKLEFLLRTIAGGLWFVGATTYGLALCALRPGHANTPHKYARALGPGMQWAMRMRVKLDGHPITAADQPCIFLPMHQSNFDIVLYGSMYPANTIVIGKREVAKMPLFGWFFKNSGNVLIDRTDRKAAIAGLDAAVQAMARDGKSIWMFPEGTRNQTGGELLQFKKGPFHMAIAAQRPLVPVVATSYRPILGQIARRDPRGGAMRVRVLPPILTAGMTAQDVDALMAQTWQVMEAARLALAAEAG